MADKELEFLGSSLKDLKEFPVAARQDAGYQLGKVQKGEEPDDWKPFSTVGVGVKEIRIREDKNIFRIMYFGSQIQGYGLCPSRISEEDANNKQARHRNSQEQV